MNGNIRNDNSNNYPNTRYTTVFLQENGDLVDKRKTGWFGTRHFVTFMLFLGMANAYIMRTNMSVAIVAMVNHTAIGGGHHDTSVFDECGVVAENETDGHVEKDGDFNWETDTQGYVLSSFFYGYVLTQIPFGILSKRYGNIYFLGYGMLINSLFGLLVPVAANMGIWWLIAIRFIQGLGEVPPIPWMSIVTSLPFWAILLAHMGHNYGYETLMTELPTYMKQIHHFSIKDNGILSALPYLAMWIFSIFISHVADWMLTNPYFTHTIVRKIINGIGQYGPAIALVAVAYTGCDRWLTVGLLTIGVGLNGGIYSGFKVNHLDISPQFAGILMSFTNCLANLAGLLAPIYAGNVVVGVPSIGKWRIVFITAACVYAACCTFYVIFASGQRQPWDQPAEEEPEKKNRTEELEVVTTRA